MDTSLIFNIFAKDHTGKTLNRMSLAAKAAFAAAGFGGGGGAGSTFVEVGVFGGG